MIPFTVKQISKKHVEQIEGIWQLDRQTFEQIKAGKIKKCFWYEDKDYGKCLVLQLPTDELKRLFLRNFSHEVQLLRQGVPQMFV